MFTDCHLENLGVSTNKCVGSKQEKDNLEFGVTLLPKILNSDTIPSKSLHYVLLIQFAYVVLYKLFQKGLQKTCLKVKATGFNYHPKHVKDGIQLKGHRDN